MYRIKTLNKISSVGLSKLDPTRFQTGGDLENEDGILVRSAPMHEYAFPDSLRAVARAGAGTNNIPIDRCSESGVVVFNTPGANANAVKELVIAAMLVASLDILGGADWVQEQAHTPKVDVAAAVEKGKSAFAGPELYKKTLGVIGLGAIGALVCNIALDLGMDVYGYDPFLSVDAALRLDRHVHVVKDVDELYKVSDYVTIHVPYNSSTKGFINAEAISKMKSAVRTRGQVCHRLPRRPDYHGAQCHRTASPGGLHPGERGELRRYGRPPAPGLPAQRQYHEFGEPARRLPGLERHRPHLPDSPECARYADPDHGGLIRRPHQCGEPDQQV